MKKAEGKIGTVILMTFVIIILIIAGIYCYLYLNKLENKIIELENTQNDQANEKPSENIIENTITNKDFNTQVKTSDLVTLYCESTTDHCDIFYAFIEDGELYYFNEFAEETQGQSNTYTWCFGNKEEMKKYPDLNNIKRMKRFNIGTGINPVPFLITTTGEVYRVNLWSQTKGEITVELYEGLKDYKVDDILSHEGEMYDIFTIKLLDGTTKTVEVKDNSVL